MAIAIVVAIVILLFIVAMTIGEVCLSHMKKTNGEASKGKQNNF